MTITLARTATWISNVLIILSVGLFLFLLTNENLFQKFVPRASCMFNQQKLISTHLVADIGIWLSYMIISGTLYWIYRAFRTKEIPFKGFFWMFAGFIFLCGVTHFIGALNIFVSYYWIDAVFKVLTCWFSIAVAISFIRAAKSIKEFKTPAEYRLLSEELEDLREQLRQKE